MTRMNYGLYEGSCDALIYNIERQLKTKGFQYDNIENALRRVGMSNKTLYGEVKCFVRSRNDSAPLYVVLAGIGKWYTQTKSFSKWGKEIKVFPRDLKIFVHTFGYQCSGWFGDKGPLEGDDDANEINERLQFDF